MIEKILILDFGSQYTQLIARRVRELNVYCEIVPYKSSFDINDASLKGIILSGSPFSVRADDALRVNLEHFLGKKPVLGICYGAQYLAQALGGLVMSSSTREYGKANIISILEEDEFLKDISHDSQVWMSHSDTIVNLPEHFELLASTETVKVAAFRAKKDAYEQPVYGIQFHPEVTHSLEGAKLLENFVINISGCKGDWTPDTFVESTVARLRSELGDDKVLMGLSGGVDSTVAAALLHRAIGKNLYCFFVDNGLLRKNEYEEVLDSYKGMGLNIIGIDAKKLFLDNLKGVSDPEGKRKIIGGNFIEVFEIEAHKLAEKICLEKDAEYFVKNLSNDDVFEFSGLKWLGQGTIYPDVIESISVHGPSVTIKSHHNVGGLPERMKLKVVEPLRFLFKDEVRKAGRAMNLPAHILQRHPFPGPGLGIRVLGEVTAEKVAMLQEADAVFIKNLKESGLYHEVWQAATILLPVQSVGVMGDERTYEFTVALRAVTSIDGMTAEWSRLPHEFLAKVSNEIINQVKGINRVVYDISTKPPATIEWE